MPESRGGGTSGRDGRVSSTWMGTEENSSSWRMERAEAEEEEDSSGKSPDIPEVDLKEQKSIQQLGLTCCLTLLDVESKLHWLH